MEGKDFSAQKRSNAQKVKAGIDTKEAVKKLLTSLNQQQLIINYEEDVNHSHKSFGYAFQFRSDFIVKTIDEKFILIRTSTSYRSDRAKIPFYDFLGIQQFSSFSGDIVASILLFPDSEATKSTFLSTRKKVEDGTFFSPATHWLTFSELEEFFSNYCSEVEEELASQEENYAPIKEPNNDYPISFANELSFIKEKTGSYYGRSGNKFEGFLVRELNDEENLSHYASGKKRCLEYEVVLNAAVEYLSIKKDQIQLLEATDTITKLKNGGSPKTDIHLKIFTEPKTFHTANISVKNTTSSRVSCHDYQAKDFARVIAPQDSDFLTVVETFQEAGSWKQYDSLLIEKGLKLDTDRILKKYMRKLVEWAITGKHDAAHLLDEEVQIANFLLTRNAENGACKMQSSESYISEQSKNISHGRGAPFSWTYPSKRRGQRIQLKMPISLPQE